MKWLAVPLLLLAGCTEAPLPEKVTYSNDIRPIVQQKCASCHGWGSPNGNWLSYSEIYLKQDEIFQRVIRKQTMPPGGLGSRERAIFLKWIRQGANE